MTVLVFAFCLCAGASDHNGVLSGVCLAGVRGLSSVHMPAYI